MAKSRKKRKTNRRQSQTKLSEERFQKYLLALLEGKEAAREGLSIFWDLGPGERPQKVLADFRHIIKKEKLKVEISNGKDGTCLVFSYPKEVVEPATFRVRGSDGVVKKEGA
ncbi:MAG: hypothetical protein GY807_03425 [Gammaproteobacteria bacterium]|nr:hypothetical protein [Gammaproteobacteria bacterium]